MKYLVRKKIRKRMNISGKQQCPICLEQQILVEHHINGRKIINANHSFNLTYICNNCHDKIHRGIIILEGYFTTTKGKELLWHYANETSFSGQDSKPYLMG